MLKYYSYYNVGGYKDMFLGDSSMNLNETYYIPLLANWKKKAISGDAEAENRVKSVENLPMIQLLSSSDKFGLPQEAEPMFSHGGYSVMLTVGLNGESIFAIRNIESDTKDDAGRTVPFLLVIVGTTSNDAIILEKVAVYASSHLDSFSKELSGLFYYDADKNGIVFRLAALETIIRKIADDWTNKLLTTSGPISIEAKPGTVPLLVVPEGISDNKALTEQGIKGVSVRTIPIGQILPLDNQKKLIATLVNAKGSRSSVFKEKNFLYIICAAVFFAFIAGFFIGKS